MMKKIRYLLEFLLLRLYVFICQILGPKAASNMGGWIGRTIGPLLAKSKEVEARIHKHLSVSPEEAKKVTKSMWENMGRLMSEYPHLKSLAENNVTIHNGELVKNLHKQGIPIMFLSGHIGNWEISPPALAHHLGVHFNGLYRTPNNPMVAELLKKMRSIKGAHNIIPKSKKGAKELIKHMKKKEHIGFLFDQKYNEGQPVPFLGQDAMSYTAIIPLSQRYNYTIIPSQVKRVDKYNFEITFHEPIALFDADGKARDEIDVFLDMNAQLEAWIKEAPAQWLWLHRRWGKQK